MPLPFPSNTIPHYVEDQAPQESAETEQTTAADTVIGSPDLIEIDAIIVDDEEYLLESFKIFAYGKKVHTFQHPQEFLNRVGQYHRTTRIMLDQTFGNYHAKGTEIAEQLNAMGFTRLYLLSGEEYAQTEIPGYLKSILKTDIEALAAAMGE